MRMIASAPPAGATQERGPGASAPAGPTVLRRIFEEGFATGDAAVINEFARPT